jgi:hypothetical protein
MESVATPKNVCTAKIRTARAAADQFLHRTVVYHTVAATPAKLVRRPRARRRAAPNASRPPASSAHVAGSGVVVVPTSKSNTCSRAHDGRACRASTRPSADHEMPFTVGKKMRAVFWKSATHPSSADTEYDQSMRYVVAARARANAYPSDARHSERV